MAVKLDTYAFKNRRRAKYDWDSWLDGDIWQLTKEEDFPDTTPRNLRTQSITVAKRRGLKVRTSIVSDTVLVIQAYKPDIVREDTIPFVPTPLPDEEDQWELELD